MAYLYIMQSIQAVLSIGRRCMQEGYTFLWKPEQDPYLITCCMSWTNETSDTCAPDRK